MASKTWHCLLGPAGLSSFRKTFGKVRILLFVNLCLYPLFCGSHQDLWSRKSFFCLYSWCVSSFPLGRTDFTLVNHASHPRASEAPMIPSGPPMEHEITKSSFSYLVPTPTPCPVTYILCSWSCRSIYQSYEVSQSDLVPVPSMQNTLSPCFTASLSTACRWYLFPFLSDSLVHLGTG